MNSHKNNEKIIQILSEMEPIHDETEDEKKRRLQMAEDASHNVEEAPLAFARKVAGIICAVLWIFSLVALLFGFGDLGVLLPFILIALVAVLLLNIPVFLKRKKISDVIIAIAAAAFCLILALGMLLVGNSR